MRFETIGALPVTEHGRLVGVLAQGDIVSVLACTDPDRRDAEMRRPVREFMREPGPVLRSSMALPEAAAVFVESGHSMLPVLDADDYYLGSVGANDLLVPDLPAPRPARIGGMATPFGVYLTDGTVRAGVGNLALMATGATMSVLFLAANGIVQNAFGLITRFTHQPMPQLIELGDDLPAGGIWIGLTSLAASLLVFLVFMALMRMTRLAGYHAAEHQTVHAIERFEVLLPDVVSRMPRAHPRCGTNLMAALLIFLTVRMALRYVPTLPGLVEILAVAATLCVWRPVGTFLQERFTTKPANQRELESGIAAGNDLLAKYLEISPVRASLARRIWCSGMPQVLLGSVPIMGISYLSLFLEPLWRSLVGH